MKILIGIGILIITWIYFQIVAERDKRFRKEIKQYNKNIKIEEKRRIREEQLKWQRIKSFISLITVKLLNLVKSVNMNLVWIL